MNNRYYVACQLTNDKDQDASTITMHESLESAKVEFHGKCRSFFNAADVKYAVVQILNAIGTRVDIETIDHIPQPESETEAE